MQGSLNGLLMGRAKLAAAESYSGSVPCRILLKNHPASRKSQEEEIKRERELRRKAEISEMMH
jgi:hypothetical protein